MSRVHIKIADRGWILEKCAVEIAQRGTGITYGTDADPAATLQYYINYSARVKRVSPVEIGFFTHSERDKTARARYFSAAKEVDHCVCMSRPYADELRTAGIGAVSIIAPGVDLDLFRPKVRIGVIGRTYHTGRKGEALVAEVMDVPGIEWHFTGSGWPGPSEFVPGDAIADFYNKLDYVLVPALYEGGPMSVLEGLACGKPIISSDVGWVSDYPHIPFENGNAASLRVVLEGLVAERQSLRESVLDRTWERWAEEHLALFDRLLLDRYDLSPRKASPYAGLGAVLLTHGTEGTTLGGPTVRVPATVKALRAEGVAAELASEALDNDPKAGIAHIYNVWKPVSCLAAMRQAREAGKKVVLSPIFLNLANLGLYNEDVPALFRNSHSKLLDRALRAAAQQVAAEPNLPIREPFPGYHEQVRTCIAYADHVICLSRYEADCLDHIGAKAKARSIVRNPVDPARFVGADPELFRKTHGLEDYILCVGRIEARKNQLMLTEAARLLGRQVVFIGHEGQPDYAGLVRAHAGPKALFIPRIDPQDPMLGSAFAGATVFALPSWAEGAPLAALEAASTGVPLVLSDRSSEKEYFGDTARYVNPADLKGLMEALEAAAATAEDTERSERQRRKVASGFRWQDHAKETAEVYKAVAQERTEDLAIINGSTRSEFAKEPSPTSFGRAERPTIYFDLTSTAYQDGMPTGIARVESTAFLELEARTDITVVPIAWSSSRQRFYVINKLEALSRINRTALLERSADDPSVLDVRKVPRNSRILIFGGAWIRNHHFINSVARLKENRSLQITLLIHDIIQMKLPYLYPGDAGKVFETNVKKMVATADSFFVYSECTRRDLLELLHHEQQYLKPIRTFRMGDFSDLSVETHSPPENVAKYSGKDFILFVSSIDIRKNHLLLLNIWRRLLKTRGEKTPYLLFVGRPIWSSEIITEQIAKDPVLGSRVHHLTGIDDQALDWLYRNCRFTVFPSVYEGWGLPIAESLAYGKMCITSTGSSTEEVAPALTDLIDPYDFRAWLDRISLYIDNPALLAKREEKIRTEFRLTSWAETMRQVVSQLDGFGAQERLAAPLLPTMVMHFSNAAIKPDAQNLLGTGWSPAEGEGCWTTEPEATLKFAYAGPSTTATLRLRLRPLMAPGQEARRLSVLVNGAEALSKALPSRPVFLDVPLSFNGKADGPAEVTVTLRPEGRISPLKAGIGEDKRDLGMQLSALVLCEDPALLDRLMPQLAASEAGPHINAPRPVAAGPIGARQEHIAMILRNCEIPARLPEHGRAFRLLRATQIDRPLLWAYRRVFARTNDSIRRLTELVRQAGN